MCHTKKSAAWASAAVEKWYGTQRKYHFAEDLIPGSKGGVEAEPHLARLLGDTAVPANIKATAAFYLGNTQTEKSLSLLLRALRENDAQLRYRAARSIASFPVERWRDAVGTLLSDKVRAVRIAAADALMQIPANEIPVSFREPLAKAKKELETYMQYQLDFAVGYIMLGDYYLRQNDFFNAEKYYTRGLKKDSMMNYARLNLASMYNQQQKNTDALRVLLDAQKTDPKNDRIQYNLALLYVEIKDQVNAEKSFTRAVSLGSGDPRLYYNFALFQQQSGQPIQAEQLLKKGLLIDPGNTDLNYALAYLYMQMKQPQKAIGPAMVLKRVDPANPDYQSLFRTLQIN
jgi:Tfp pilus assembly protein PilF